jgi:hypothetical protein
MAARPTSSMLRRDEEIPITGQHCLATPALMQERSHKQGTFDDGQRST